MKNKLYIIGVLCMVMVLAMSLIACSTGEPESETPPPPSDSSTNNPISPETQAKINAVYSKATIGPQTVTTVQQLATLTSIAYTPKGGAPIGVVPARLNGEDITLITLSGTEFKEGQATTIEESRLASMGKGNDYLSAVLKLFRNRTIPKDKPILVTGISLGGMIAQQLLGQGHIVNGYDIKAVVTFGSPITLPFDRHGVPVIRFTDKNDQVPKAGEIGLLNALRDLGMTKAELDETMASLNNKECIIEQCDYTDPIEVHALSYINEPCWNAYDFLGATAGTNTLELLEDMKFYEAPKLSK